MSDDAAATASRDLYWLSSFSLGQLIGVHPKLVAVVQRAIRITDQDFRVTDGIRTVPEQRKLLLAGNSWTSKSRHLLQPDGFGHAVDLVPWADGLLSWSWPLCYKVAAAVSEAAREMDIELRWGGVWDRPMSDYGCRADDVREAVAAYVARRRQAGRRASIDGPHFELA